MGGSQGFVPSWAEEEKVTRHSEKRPPDPSKREGTAASAATTTGPKKLTPEQKARMVESQEGYRKCVNALFEHYVSNNVVDASPEVGCEIYERTLTVPLCVVPVVSLRFLSEEDKEAEGRSGAVAAGGLHFEITNYRDVFGVASPFFKKKKKGEFEKGGREEENDDETFQYSGKIGETAYAIPLEISVVQTMSHLPFPVSVRISNVMFSKPEIDEILEKRELAVGDAEEYRRNNPLSKGSLREASDKIWRGDAFANRSYSSAAYLRREEEKKSIGDGEEEGEESSEKSESCADFGRYVSTSYLCRTGDYEADVRYEKRRRSAAAAHEGKRDREKRDLVVEIKPSRIRAFHSSAADGERDEDDAFSSVVYESDVTADAVSEYYRAPYECLQSRLSPCSSSDRENVEGFHVLVDPDLIRYNQKEEHLKAMETVSNFVGGHEFYFESDFMMKMYAIVARRRRGGSSSESKKPEASKVGRYEKGELHLDLLGKSKKLDGRALADTYDYDAIKKVSGVYAVSKTVCDSVREQIYRNVHEKVLFSDFSDPRIEVNVGDEVSKAYLTELESSINASLAQGGVSAPSFSKKERRKEIEQSLLPVLVNLRIRYLRVNYPTVLS
jgi:hypothetical protein